jgi:hypothetical protein
MTLSQSQFDVDFLWQTIEGFLNFVRFGGKLASVEFDSDTAARTGEIIVRFKPS